MFSDSVEKQVGRPNQCERSGIKRYLVDELKPRFGKHWPKVEPVPVNLPEPT